jgi:hypothetical protein
VFRLLGAEARCGMTLTEGLAMPLAAPIHGM